MQKTARKEAVLDAAASGNLWTHFYMGFGNPPKNDQMLLLRVHAGLHFPSTAFALP